MASNRRRRNKINYFKDEEGNWINDHKLIMSHVSNYFKDIFTSSHTSTKLKPLGSNPSNLNKIDLRSLDSPLLDLEIKKAIFFSNLLKHPARMASIHSFIKDIGTSLVN